eukprot:jgi/Astpho2/1020/e_gw1.00016.22.1_t
MAGQAALQQSEAGSSSPAPLEKFQVYCTRGFHYIVGSDKAESAFRVLKLSRHGGPELEAFEDATIYSKSQCSALLSQIHAGNLLHKGLQLVCEAVGIIGCVRFLERYYLLLVTKSRSVGTVCGQKVYGISETALVPLLSNGKMLDCAAEKRYRRILLSGVELNKDFYFSYTYNLGQTLQASLTAEQPHDCFESRFVWNEYLSRPLRKALSNGRWAIPLIHGFWQQRTLSLLGQTLTLTVVSRRSKHFAGTRYRKRGVNDKGQVANDVETEQILHAGQDRRTGMPLLSSALWLTWLPLVQVRGSIPLYWLQQGTTKLKPDILLQRFDPLYRATQLHFEDLGDRYGHPTVVLSLVKSAEKRPRETILRKEFNTAISYINQQRRPKEHISYIPWDFNYHAKQQGNHILADIAPVIQVALKGIGIFVVPGGSQLGEVRTGVRHEQGETDLDEQCLPLLHLPLGFLTRACSSAAPSAWRRLCGLHHTVPGPHMSLPTFLQDHAVQLQHGVLRTNCIDCLDRTNVAQFAFGLAALGRQLHALGLAEGPELDARSSLARQLMDLYEVMGNVLARQYGGSEAHSTFFQRQRGDWEPATQSRELLTSIRRFYSNAYTDADKQDAINLFLGNFVPTPGQPALWELDSDYYLHTGDTHCPLSLMEHCICKCTWPQMMLACNPVPTSGQPTLV